jgi:hypothetical protein
MPVYRMIANLPQPFQHNGKTYNNGDIIANEEGISRVVVTEGEAKLMNERQDEIRLVLDEDIKVKTSRPLAQMNKVELMAVGKELGLELDEILTRDKMKEQIVAKQDEIKKI